MNTKGNVIYIYKVDFGGQIDSTSLRETKRVIKNVSEDINQKYGCFNSYGETLITKVGIE